MNKNEKPGVLSIVMQIVCILVCVGLIIFGIDNALTCLKFIFNNSYVIKNLILIVIKGIFPMFAGGWVIWIFFKLYIITPIEMKKWEKNRGESERKE